MAHIDLKNELPGIRGPMAFSPETAKPLNALAEVLLRDDNNTLTRGERIDRRLCFVTQRLFLCQNVHGLMAQYYMN
jgi:hypothetical protein